MSLDEEDAVGSGGDSDSKQREEPKLSLGKLDKQDSGDMELERLRLQFRLEEARGSSLENQVRLTELQGGRRASNVCASQFDLGKAIKVVPSFNEIHLDEFFDSIERLAARLSWPRDQWTLILQQTFKGKALKAYMSLPDQEASNYRKVKKQVL